MIPDDVPSLRKEVEEYQAATNPKDRLDRIQRIEAFFEEDNRVELSSAPAWAQTAARSVAAVWQTSNFTTRDGQAGLCTNRLADSLSICAGHEPVFARQLVPCHRTAYGTAFVVAREGGALAFLTARHVVLQVGVAGIACVFGYHGAVPPTHVPASDLIRFSRVIDEGPEAFNDWVLLEPAQPVDGAAHPPMDVHRGAIAAGQEVATLGFPFGVPMKFAAGARIHSVDGFGLHTDLDTAKGNSGSPVLALMQGRPVVIGIARETPRDFVIVNGCHVEAPCKLTVPECANGTIAVPITAVRGLM